jgi:hypothetical protein
MDDILHTDDNFENANEERSLIQGSEYSLSFGTDCKQSDHQLKLIALQELYNFIIDSPPGIIEFSNTLRSVLRYSKERYSKLKTSLPYFCASVFDPPVRRMQHFRYANGMILDIDQKQHVSEKQISGFKNDLRIALGYISPSKMGIKLLILFDEPINDADIYTAVYKRFSTEFAATYHLMDKLDQRNSDISRISFICHDPGAWMQTEYIPVIWRDYYDFHSHFPVVQDPVDAKQGISEHTYKLILDKLGSKAKTVKSKVPLMPEIEGRIEEIRTALAEYEINLDMYEGLQYGAKLTVSMNNDKGELNVYFGKRGYSVVVSARKHTNIQLSQTARQIVEMIL